jgi:hypothetical protein
VKRLSEQSLYEILEVPPDAAAPQIEDAYARARELYGPGSLATYSLVAPEEASALAERIEEAKRVLLDPDARARYDARLAADAAAAEAAVRIAATGSGAVAAGPQRPWVVPPPTLTPVPAAEPKVGPGEQGPSPSPAKAAVPPEPPAPAAAGVAVVAPLPVAEPAAVAPPPVSQPSPGPILLQQEVASPPAAREFPVPDGAVWTGEAIRKVRESRALSVREVCDRTKITRYHLENIEGDRFTLLPAPVYLRGILVAVARELRLDGQKVARSYLERMTSAGGDPQKPR